MLKLFAMTRCGRAVPLKFEDVLNGAVSRWRLRTRTRSGVTVSTAFVPIDMDLTTPEEEKDAQEYLPLVFETAVIGGEFDGLIRRYRLITDAIEWHNQTVAYVDTRKQRGLLGSLLSMFS